MPKPARPSPPCARPRHSLGGALATLCAYELLRRYRRTLRPEQVRAKPRARRVKPAGGPLSLAELPFNGHKYARNGLAHQRQLKANMSD
jgi:hypothetical protein